MTPETAIKHTIRDYLTVHKWFVFPILQGMGAYKGISDLVACKDGKTMFIEVKAPRGKQSEHQAKFEINVKQSGCHYLIARGYEDVRDYMIKNDL